MSSNKKNLLRTVFTANGSCGCSKTKTSEVHEPTPKPKPKPKTSHIHPKINLCSMASSTTSIEHEEDFTSTTISESDTFCYHNNNNNNNNNNDNVLLKRSPLVDSVAIEKDSSNPYNDFRHSMLQMIFEKEIESEEDLQDLLQCFLHLNAPCHHHVIVKAFKEICQEAFPNKVSTTPVASEPSPSSKNPLIVPKSPEYGKGVMSKFGSYMIQP